MKSINKIICPYCHNEDDDVYSYGNDGILINEGYLENIECPKCFRYFGIHISLDVIVETNVIEGE